MEDKAKGTQKIMCDCEKRGVGDKCCELEGGMTTVNGGARGEFIHISICFGKQQTRKRHAVRPKWGCSTGTRSTLAWMGLQKLSMRYTNIQHLPAKGSVPQDCRSWISQVTFLVCKGDLAFVRFFRGLKKQLLKWQENSSWKHEVFNKWVLRCTWLATCVQYQHKIDIQ